MPNFSEIKKSLLTLHPFTEEQLTLFTNKLTEKELKKKKFLIAPNQIANGISFINTGSLRFYTKTQHAELTIHFFTENTWVTDIESLLTQHVSKNYIEAFDDSYIFSITLTDIHALMDIHPCFRILNALLVNLTISPTQLALMNTKSPDVRYKTLLLTHPNWINRFPQLQIASYLGITPETLSRVRARIT
jgi:CRP/FNR family transcriptional regulator, anaerobic regulatory protein